MFRAFQSDLPHSPDFPVRNACHPYTVSENGPELRTSPGAKPWRAAPYGRVRLYLDRRSSPPLPRRGAL
jgi:hypothetical protein